MAETITSSAAEAYAPATPKRKRILLRKTLDALTVGSSVGGALAMIGLLLLLAGVLAWGAWPAIKTFGWRFLIDSDWDPVGAHFGAWPAIFGTLASSILALLLAVPVSVGAAVFLTRLAPRWLKGPASFLIELLAAIPSIAYGFWGITIMVPFLQKCGQPFLRALFGHVPVIGQLFSGAAYGSSLLAGAIIIAIMILPIVTAVTRDVLQVVPREIEEGAYALGATWWQATREVINFGRLGIFGAMILGLARAVGETMAVTMVIGNGNTVNLSLFAPSQTMASLLANEFLEADRAIYVKALIYIALVLLALTILLNGAARMLVMRMTMRSISRKENATEPPSTASDDTQEAQAAALAARPSIPIKHDSRLVRASSHVMKSLCAASAVLALTLLLCILGYILMRGASSLNLDFFTKLPGPVGSPSGMRNCLAGTLILIGLGSGLGVPLGMLTGIYLSEYSHGGWFTSTVRLVVDVLAGTPSIVVGVLAYELVVVPSGHFSGWAGALALGFLMAPIVARTTEEMLKLVPAADREAALAVGGSKFHTLFGVVIPAAGAGIVTGIMLAVARIAGETAPLIFTALGSDSDTYDPSKPFPSLTLKVFNYATSAESEWIKQAWAGMLVLIAVVFILSAAVRHLARNRAATI